MLRCHHDPVRSVSGKSAAVDVAISPICGSGLTPGRHGGEIDLLVGHPEVRPSYAVSSICRRRCWERFQAAIRMIAQQPTALPKNTDAIVQSFWFTSA
jgi:hypothetical protein